MRVLMSRSKKPRKPPSKTPRDPHLARESAKYDRPVPSRELILQQLKERGKPLSAEQLCRELGVSDEADQESFQRRLGAMVRDGQLIRNRVGEYGAVDEMDLVRGRVIGHPEGFGFLVCDEGGPDLFIPQFHMRRLLHGDRALVRITGKDKRGRLEAAVVEVLERVNREVVGRFIVEGQLSFVEPDNRRISQDIMVPDEDRGGASHGQIVVVTIIEQPSKRSPPVGRVTEVLGDHMDPGMEIDVAIRAHEMPVKWPEPIQREIEQYGDKVQAAAIEAREDIRKLPLVTIDGADARDFDDAVFCEKVAQGWRLLVAIADVSHYVKPGMALDEEGYNRGNSVYFPDRVIPMLPEVLSNGLCSLNPQVDRLCMVCEMVITPKGEMTSHRFFAGVMWSHARLTYSKAAAMLVDKDAALRKKYASVLTPLEDLYALYKVLRTRRDKRGAIDFDTTETRIIFGKGQKIERIVPMERNEAHKIIEECMISANVAAAQFLEQHHMPCLYRIHEGPSEDKLNDLREFLRELGLFLGGSEDPLPGHYAKLLELIQERQDTHLIQTVMLRSLSRAVYSPDNVGHFGLALETYAHFTSPIRRYPDLLVHRAIRHVLGGGDAKSFQYNHHEFVKLGEHCSMTERRADEATRDAVDWLKCEFMLDKVGDDYDGIITAVTGFGIFVELKETYVEGLVHITALPGDYYHHDPAHHRLVGDRTRRMFRLADPVRVKVARVDLDSRRIDFELSSDNQVSLSDAAPSSSRGKRHPHKPRKEDRKGKKKTTKKARKKTAKKTSKKRGRKNISTRRR
ncbi:MAG: ribonuclease R [Gammaproteobacteria bacterium]|nr:MAG: ribonuclease R [Gammaproteobacteria bacterium]